MRRHRNQLLLRLDDKEYNMLTLGAAKTGLTMTTYIRQLICGYAPKETPHPDYYSMMEQLYQVGINLNQIAKKAHVLNVIDVQKYDEAMQSYNKIIRDITESVILPKRLE